METRPVDSLFSMPRASKITGRTSSITNAFINAIIPKIYPTSEQIQLALRTLGMSLDNFHCSYCGDPASEWDHLRPVVEDKRPTGYISEIANLVPACGKCNQSKGNKYWHDWILSNAKLSPQSRGIADLETRIKRLQSYEDEFTPTHIDFAAEVPAELWVTHWSNWQSILDTMKESQITASAIAEIISRKYAEDQ